MTTSNPGVEPSPSQSQTDTSVAPNPADTKVNDANSAKTDDQPKDDAKDTVTPPTNGKSELPPLPDNPTLDDILARISPEEAEQLTATEIDDLVAGKPEAVARILKLPPASSTVPPPSSNAPKVDPAAPKTDDDKGLERISLRGLSAKDQVAVARAIQAVKDGKYSTFEEARIDMAKPADNSADDAKTDTDATDDDPPPVALTSTPKIEELQKQLDGFEVELSAAQKAYDTGKISELTRKLTRLEINLEHEKERLEATNKEALQQHEQAKAEKTQWITDQQVHIDAITKANAELADPKSALSIAFRKEQAFAQAESDPVFDTAEWPIEILKRAKGSLGTTKTPPLPTPPAQQRQPLGMLEQPTNNGPTMTVDEAMDEIDKIPEHEREAYLDKLLASMREKEEARRRFGGR
jgi:hypothetical protein